MSKSNKFIKQILYHEFTHLSDSMSLLDYPIEDFINIMQSYSEYHASEVEMIERLNQVKIVDFNSLVIYDKGDISLKNLIINKLNDLKFDITKMNENCKSNDIFYETANLYYYCGYLKAVKSYGLNCDAYKIDILKLPPTQLSPACCNISNYLLKDDIDYKTVLKMYKEFNDSILICAKINQFSKK